MKAILAPPSTVDQKTSKMYKGMVLARKGGELAQGIDGLEYAATGRAALKS